MLARRSLLAVSSIFLLSLGTMASKCKDPPPTEIQEEAKLSGTWDYQRDVNGGCREPGGFTVLWLLHFESEPGKVHFYAGEILEYDADFGFNTAWQHTGGNIQAQYEFDGKSVTFRFDDWMNPRRSSFTGELVSSRRIQGDWENGDFWVAELCDPIEGNCGGSPWPF